jgi:hypothetical protein
MQSEKASYSLDAFSFFDVGVSIPFGQEKGTVFDYSNSGSGDVIRFKLRLDDTIHKCFQLSRIR